MKKPWRYYGECCVSGGPAAKTPGACGPSGFGLGTFLGTTFTIISPRLFQIMSHHPSFIIHHPSSIIQHPSSIIHHPSFIIHHPSSIIHHPSSIIHHPSSIIHHPSTIIHHQSNLIDCLPPQQGLISQSSLISNYDHNNNDNMQGNIHSCRGLPFGDGLIKNVISCSFLI